MKHFAFAILCLIIATASRIEAAERGINAKEGEFKYQAILYHHYYRPNPACGAAILNELYVLSSAGCTAQFVGKLDKLTAFVGTLDIYNVKQKREIAEIKIPEEFVMSEKHHDIALVKVTEKFEFATNIQPVNLPTSSDVFNGPLFSSGFGIRFHPEHMMETVHRADHLHYHETSVVPMDECKAIYEESKSYVYKNGNLGDDFVCTKNVDGFDFTYGDGGNPLVADNVIYGVASWTHGSTDYPNVYTKVYSHKKWIEENSSL